MEVDSASGVDGCVGVGCAVDLECVEVPVLLPDDVSLCATEEREREW